MAEKLSVPCDPENFDADCTLVLVKCWFDGAQNFKRVLLDVVDAAPLINFAYKYKEVEVVASSVTAKHFLEARLSNEIHLIPQHHCNFEREVRSRDSVSVVGYVGSKFRLDLDVAKLAIDMLNEGLEFRTFFVEDINVTRESVCEFLKGIDINLAWSIPRPELGPPELKTPLKLVNAGSFKIPTVSRREACFRFEGEGMYVEVQKEEDIVEACAYLRECESSYKSFASSAYAFSEHYHIDNVIETYKRVLWRDSDGPECDIEHCEGAVAQPDPEEAGAS